MKLRKLIKEDSSFLYLGKGHKDAKPFTWGGGNNLTEDESKPKEKRSLLFGQADDENEVQITNEMKLSFLEAVKAFNKYGESVYREANLKEAKEEICEIGKMATKIALSETAEWFDGVSVQKDMKALDEDIKSFEKTANEAVQLQQRLESCFESIGHKLGKYFEIADKEQPMQESIRKKRKLMERTHLGSELPKGLTENDFGDIVESIEDLEKQKSYILKEYGLNQWLGEMIYVGIIRGEYTFKSNIQFDDFELAYTKNDLIEAINHNDIYEMNN